MGPPEARRPPFSASAFRSSCRKGCQGQLWLRNSYRSSSHVARLPRCGSHATAAGKTHTCRQPWRRSRRTSLRPPSGRGCPSRRKAGRLWIKRGAAARRSRSQAQSACRSRTFGDPPGERMASRRRWRVTHNGSRVPVRKPASSRAPAPWHPRAGRTENRSDPRSLRSRRTRTR